MTETTPTATVTLEQLTAEAKSQLAEILELDAKKAAIDSVYERAKAAKVIALGTTLNLIKCTLPHGGWYPWLAANFDGSKSTATRCMQCAELANRATLHGFGYSQLLQLLPMASNELPAFFAAMDKAGTPAADMSVRNLREAVKNWRHKSQFSPKVETIDVPASTITVEVRKPPTALPTLRLPAQSSQLCLFDLPPASTLLYYGLPSSIVEMAKSISVPVFLITRADIRADLPVPAIFVATSPTASWLKPLKSIATASVLTRLQFPLSDGRTKARNALILYNGTDVDKFAEHFARFGDVNIPYTKKASALSTSKLLD